MPNCQFLPTLGQLEPPVRISFSAHPSCSTKGHSRPEMISNGQDELEDNAKRQNDWPLDYPKLVHSLFGCPWRLDFRFWYRALLIQRQPGGIEVAVSRLRIGETLTQTPGLSIYVTGFVTGPGVFSCILHVRFMSVHATFCHISTMWQK